MTTQLISNSGQLNPQFGAWNIANEYLAGDTVTNNGSVYEANDAIPGGTPFVVGTTGATWKVTVAGAGATNIISNGTSNVDIATADAAVTISANSQANIFVIASNGTHASTSISDDVTVTGNLTVQGTTTFINVTSQSLTDPIIDLGVGANNTILTTADSTDRGVAMHNYYDGNTYTTSGSTPQGNTVIVLTDTTGIGVGMEVGVPSELGHIPHGATVSSVTPANITISVPTTAVLQNNTVLAIGRDYIRFMGWDTSNNHFVIASQTAIDGNNNVSFNEYGNILMGNVTAQAITANGNISLTGDNISLGNISNLHIANGSNGQFIKTDGNGNLSWSGATTLVTLDTSSSTKPADPLSGDLLVVTDTGLYDGVVQEEWVYDGEDWIQVIGTPPVSGSVIDNTIADSNDVSVIGTYIVPATGTANAFVGEENNFAAFDGSGFTFSTPTNGVVQLINAGTNAGQLWKYNSTGPVWATVNGGALTTYNWVLTYSYSAGSLVVYNGNIYQANGNIPANTAWAVGVTGATWKAVSAGGAYNAQTFTATAGQTVFTPLSQTPVGAVAMYVNGMLINATAVSTSGTTVTYNKTNNGNYTLIAGDLVTITYMYGSINTNLVNGYYGSVTNFPSTQTTTSSVLVDVTNGSFILPLPGVYEVTFNLSMSSSSATIGGIVTLANAAGTAINESFTIWATAGAAVVTQVTRTIYITTTTANETYKLRYSAQSGSPTITINNVNSLSGTSILTWRMISGYTPITSITSTTTSFGNITASNVSVPSGLVSAGYITTTGVIEAGGYVKMGTYTVAALPSAASSAGVRAFVTDANTTTFYANVGNGGSNFAPVFSTGSVWKIG